MSEAGAPSPGPPDAAPAGPPEPEVRRRRGISLVWIVPVVVLAVGAWLVWHTLAERGPKITIAFKTADGIEPGKTRIRYKNIEIGLVESVRFSDDFSHVLLTAQMARDTAQFLRRGTRFWVVKPRLSLHGVSGLGTLLSGAYVEIEPGAGAEQHYFEGLESPPVVKAEEAGRRITLVADKLGSLDAGSPIYYRGIAVGEILGHELASDHKSVLVYGFVHAPFDRLVHSNSRFWNVSGIDVSMSSEGLKVRTESMQSVLFGGIAFETPDTPEPRKVDLGDVIFTLHDSKADITEKAFTQRVRFVLYFEGSVRGLNVGAPVEFKGIKVGSVVDVRLEFDPKDTTFRIPVVIELEPERVVSRGEGGSKSPYEILKTLVDRGLRARLQTGSLLTGQLYVELDMHPETPIRLVNAGGPYPELPTIQASLEEITSSVKTFLAKLDKLDLEGIGRELLGTLHGTNRLANSEEIKASLVDLRASLATFRAILGKVDARVDPLTTNVQAAAAAGRKALTRVQTTLGLLDALLRSDSPLQKSYIGLAGELSATARSIRESDSPLQAQAIRMAEQLSETARSIRAFVELLERNPNSIIFGKPGPGAR